MKNHECTTGHIDNLVSLSILEKAGKEESLGFALNKSISEYNKKFKENLEALKYVVKVLFFIGCHELPLRDGGVISVNKKELQKN